MRIGQTHSRALSLHSRDTQTCCYIAVCCAKGVDIMQCIGLMLSLLYREAHLVITRAVTPITANRKPPKASTTPIVIPMGKCEGAAVALLVGITASAEGSMGQHLRACSTLKPLRAEWHLCISGGVRLCSPSSSPHGKTWQSCSQKSTCAAEAWKGAVEPC